jgi:hypothetical protein
MPPLTVSSLPTKDSTPQKENKTTANSERYLCRLIGPTNLPNIYLVFVGFGGILAAVWTLKAIRGQTEVAQVAADAAVLNAQAIIKSERPWMLFTEIAGVNLEPIEVQQIHPTVAGLNFENSGKTVAKITAWKFGLFITGLNQVPPPSVFDTSGVNFKPTVIPKDAPLPHMAYLDDGRIIKQEELRNITERRTSDLWLCGIIRYQDVFEPENEHLTKICRRYEVLGLQPMFVLDGPAEYNTET